MTHDIPEDVTNSAVNHCINEYVRRYDHRDMLRDKWFKGMTLESIADKYGISVTTTKDVIYGIGDKILVRASQMK